VRVCTSNVWLYNTKIPNDSVGDLYGSLEKLVDGTFVGSTAVATNTAGTPPIDYTAPGYTISAMFTIDGATSITCADALTYRPRSERADAVDPRQSGARCLDLADDAAV
jgi:hypothetical protein